MVIAEGPARIRDRRVRIDLITRSKAQGALLTPYDVVAVLRQPTDEDMKEQRLLKKQRARQWVNHVQALGKEYIQLSEKGEVSDCEKGLTGNWSITNAMHQLFGHHDQHGSYDQSEPKLEPDKMN